MKITKTWMIERVRETSWPRGALARMPAAATPVSAVVAVVGIKGDTMYKPIPPDTSNKILPINRHPRR